MTALFQMGVGTATNHIGLDNLWKPEKHWQNYYYFPKIDVYYRIVKTQTVPQVTGAFFFCDNIHMRMISQCPLNRNLMNRKNRHN